MDYMEKGGGMLDYAAILFITFSNRDLNRTTVSSCGPDNDVLKKSMHMIGPM